MSSKPKLTIEERRILEFALRWYPYGGGEREDILPTFGVDVGVFYARVARLLLQHPQCFGRSVADAIADVARKRRAYPQH